MGGVGAGGRAGTGVRRRFTHRKMVRPCGGPDDYKPVVSDKLDRMSLDHTIASSATRYVMLEAVERLATIA